MTEPKLPSAPNPAGETANQCDGCALGLPIDGKGNHLREGAVFGIHMSCTKRKYAAPIAPAAVSTKVGSVAGWTLYRAVRDFLDSARAGTPFGLEVMDAAVSEWEAENPPRARPSAEGDGWIAVTPETMPADRAVVQCYRAGYQYVCAYRADSMWPFQTHSGAYVAATHWRSLPAPPSGQGEVR